MLHDRGNQFSLNPLLLNVLPIVRIVVLAVFMHSVHSVLSKGFWISKDFERTFFAAISFFLWFFFFRLVLDLLFVANLTSGFCFDSIIYDPLYLRLFLAACWAGTNKISLEFSIRCLWISLSMFSVFKLWCITGGFATEIDGNGNLEAGNVPAGTRREPGT